MAGTSLIPDFYAIIPAGGVGSRLWPLSRADAPKFLHDLTGSGQTLLRDTWDRLVPIAGKNRIMVVTGKSHRAAVAEQLIELSEDNTVLEIEPRDSTAAIGLAAAILERREPGVIIGSFAADHVISGTMLFRSAVIEAVAAARAGYIATIGITPTEPVTGFGYIESGEKVSVPGAESLLKVTSFVEKPDLPTAERYLEDGRYLWNAGMFIARAIDLLAEIARSKPELHAGLLTIAEAWDDPSRRVKKLDEVWLNLEKIAIDYSVAEPAAAAGRLAVVRGHFAWDDVGDFASLAKLNTAGRSGELAILGEGARVLADDASGIVVSRSKRVISLIGVHDIVVVDTPDALLVTTSEHAQRVKKLVEALRLGGSNDVL